MKNISFAILFMSFFYGQSLTIPSGVTIEMSGEVEMEFIDVEGEPEGLAYRNGYILVSNTEDPSVALLRASWAQ